MGRVIRATLLASTFLISATCWASPATSVLESTIGRFLLGETSQGLAMMSQVLGKSAAASDVELFVSRLRAEQPRLAEQLETRFASIHEEIELGRSSRKKTNDSSSFLQEERVFLRSVAERELTLETELSLRETPGTRQNFRARQESFLNNNELRVEEVKIPETPIEKASRDIVDRASRALNKIYEDAYKKSEVCMNERPDDLIKKSNAGYLRSQMAISAGVSAAGFTIKHGFASVVSPEFAIDLSMTLANQWVSVKWMGMWNDVKANSHFARWQLRWLKVFTLGMLRGHLQTEIYRIAPWEDHNGAEMKVLAPDLRDFNYTWTETTSVINPTLYTAIEAAECLMEKRSGPKAEQQLKLFKHGTFALRTAVSTTTSYLYYNWRDAKVRVK